MKKKTPIYYPKKEFDNAVKIHQEDIENTKEAMEMYTRFEAQKYVNEKLGKIAKKVFDTKIENPKDEVRKSTPIFTGVLKYFPDALEEVAKASLAGNKQHLDGKPLHWDKTKSMQQEDSLLRHLTDVAKGIEVDDDGVLHRAKMAWRALASLQIYLENKK